MDKGIGFNRNIKLEWLDATAAFCAETNDPAEVRARLEPVLALDRTGKEAIRKSIDILINIWLKSKDLAPVLYEQAVSHFQVSQNPDDRLWLHYGLTMLYYPFFRQCVTAIGQLSRIEDTINNKAVINRMAAEVGYLGSLERSVQRVVASLRDWGILTDSNKRYTYEPKYQAISTDNLTLEAWFLACTLTAHPVHEMPIADLLHLPALFPFQFSITLNELRSSNLFEIQRQGVGLNMVRVV